MIDILRIKLGTQYTVDHIGESGDYTVKYGQTEFTIQVVPNGFILCMTDGKCFCYNIDELVAEVQAWTPTPSGRFARAEPNIQHIVKRTPEGRAIISALTQAARDAQKRRRPKNPL